MNSNEPLLLNYIDETAAQNPTKIAFQQVISIEPKQADIQINYYDLANLINRTAWWLEENGLSCPDATITYIAPSDLRHIIITLAVAKTGGKALLSSPRNSTQIIEHLLEETDCSRVIYDSNFKSTVSRLPRDVQAVQMPDLMDMLYDKTPSENYPYDNSSRMLDRSFLILHTSGSTGMPKPIIIPHSYMAAITAQGNMSADEHLPQKCQLEIMTECQKVHTAFPLFHIAGIGLAFHLMFSGCTLVFGCPNQPPSYHQFKAILQMTGADATLLPPLILDEMADDISFIEENIPKLCYIFYGGGSVSQKAGNRLSKKVCLMNGIGSTECGSIAQFPTDPEHWEYIFFCEEQFGIKWRPTETSDGDCEMVIYRDDRIAKYQAVFKVFPHLTEWATRDIYRQHPTIKHLWKYQGRTDDIIVFSSGEKMSPVILEGRLASLSPVRAALVLGNQRPYPILLVELQSSTDPDDAVESIKGVVDEFNREASRDAQISRQDIIFTAKDKPFSRTIKETVHRRQTERLYEAEIDDLYSRHDGNIPVQLDMSSQETFKSSLAELVSYLTAKEIKVDDDFFMHGLDSRQVQIMAAYIERSVKTEVPAAHAVYMHPTAHRLAAFILKSFDLKEDENGYDAVLERHVRSLPQTTRECIDSETDHPFLGLPEHEYKRLSESITKIIHCQWPVNFNWPLSLFEPNIKGVVSLINFAHESYHNAHIIFLSSIASVKNWDQPTPVPEGHVSSVGYAQTGYGQSKLLASELLHQAGQSGIQSFICRIGQVAGPIQKQGAWPRRDWFPTLLFASKEMKCLPDSLGSDVDWIPVDILAEVIGELVQRHSRCVDDRCSYYHLVNPHTTRYEDLLPVIMKRLDCRIVSLDEWVRLLEQKSGTGGELLGFYQELASGKPTVRLSVNKMNALRTMDAVTKEWMEIWLDQWGL
ncbi:hypothetical protein ASPWEDRAFT_736901 [Aspergillus wentii DTO 134E9]|uniref:Carrier domain-containing protein n=1 Tax=Aspergillus wentii DTO 134E9 TaxID=1073089 RepID=A0A1L9RYB9_ASPWE|nr:uncharacterized protein ASPWEDRAFT_736901 [Aspergillus wentii DTO 134E9]OJJ39941.1 hypothetical protein ASPWEDRAFT_736901 [Aspergillus wentii DTO 134E9]